MGMSNMLKTFGKHLLIPYGIILTINILLTIIGLVFKVSNTLSLFYYSFSVNTVFSFLIGYILYGSYGRSFALIQNNKKSFTLSSLIFIIADSILLTLLVFLLGTITHNITISFVRFIPLLFFYLGIAYLGGLYGLLVKNKKITKLLIMIIVIGLSFVFIDFLVTQIYSFILDGILSTSELYIKYLIWIGIFSIALAVTCNMLYLKLNIAKVYSHE